MPEYLAPGVYVEVTSNRREAIMGVSTTIAGFIGPCASGPVDGEPIMVSSLRDYERNFGMSRPLVFDGCEMPDYLSQSVRLYFENGGKQLLISRVFKTLPGQDVDDARACGVTLLRKPMSTTLRARYPGLTGNQTIRVQVLRSENLVVEEDHNYRIRNLSPGDLVEVCEGPARGESIIPGTLTLDQLCCALADEAGTVSLYHLNGEPLQADLTTVALQRITLSMEVMPLGETQAQTFIELSTHPEARRFVGTIFFSQASKRITGRDPASPSIELVSTIPEERTEQLSYAGQLMLALTNLPGQQLIMSGGHDGVLPGSETYHGKEDADRPTGLQAVQRAMDLSILAAPCVAALPSRTEQNEIRRLLVEHCGRLRTCFTVLSGPLDASREDIRDVRRQLDSRCAALYYPSLTIETSSGSLMMPPDGAIAGIYARTDIDRGVHKAPANIIINGITGVTVQLNDAQQDILNQEHINCLRDFGERGIMVWGARTLSSNPNWRYVNVSRTMMFLYESIRRGTMWAVFQPNTETVLAVLHGELESFLYTLWRDGYLTGSTPDEAFYVKCGHENIAHTDLETYRPVCEVGVALLRPAEFVIFRIDQFADVAN